MGCKGTKKKSKQATKNTVNILQKLNKVIDTFLESNNSEYESNVIQFSSNFEAELETYSEPSQKYTVLWGVPHSPVGKTLVR